MTDTRVDDIVVIGQRRPPRSDDPFPQRQTTGIPDPLPEENAELPPGGGGDGLDDPCADPAKRMEWNSDAEAADANREFSSDAASRGEAADLSYREYGFLLELQDDGSVTRGAIHRSPPFDVNGHAEIAWTWEGVNPARVIGSIHSQRPGSHRPSQGDLDHLAWIAANMNAANPGSGDRARIYIVARNGNMLGQEYNQINVYDQVAGEAALDEFREGPEVNPSGEQC